MNDKMPDDLREVLFKGFTGCTNHSCIITGPKTGMGTNGSCHCLVNFNRSQLNILQSRLSVVLQAKYISEQKHAEGIEATKTEWYERGKAGYLEAVAAKQAVIDRLMLEYCPDEMSEQQLDDYSGSQVSVDLCGPQIAALKAEHCAEMAVLCDEIIALVTSEYVTEDQIGVDENNETCDVLIESIELIKQRISDE